VRVSVRVINADGFQILSERFETVSDTLGVFKFSDKIGSDRIGCVGREQSRLEKLRSTLSFSMAAINSISNPSEAAENCLYSLVMSIRMI
jgi:hypothetical protein